MPTALFILASLVLRGNVFMSQSPCAKCVFIVTLGTKVLFELKDGHRLKDFPFRCKS